MTLSNLLSLSRIPLAFLFLSESVVVRVLALILAGASDYLDGFIARRTGTVTRAGAILDPLMDKFFLFFVLAVLGSEATLNLWQIGAFVARDIFLFIFTVYLLITGEWRNCTFRSFIWGKLTTCVQYLLLFLIVIGLTIPLWPYLVLLALGALFFVELFLVHRQII